MWYCAACGKVLVVGDFAINSHEKMFCTFECEATYESRDVEKVIETSLDAQEGQDAEG